VQIESKTFKPGLKCSAEMQPVLWKDSANREQNIQARLEMFCRDAESTVMLFQLRQKAGM